MHKASSWFVFSWALLLPSLLVQQPAEPPLRKLTSIDLPGPKGKRFDYVTTDPDDHFIVVAQMDDQNHFRKLADMPAQKKVHSLAIDLETHRVYTPLQEEDGAPASRLVVYEAH
ncbi:MAG: hypothetical protein DMG36_11615 [Acidobacteria bacterium]|nr:MAG: hypothetical protein DMG36_11615 [Acidobacteriota bacterium]